MEIIISEDKNEMGRKAAEDGAALIQKAIEERGEAYIIVATGASQFEMLSNLVHENIDWTKVIAFHLDEYIDLPFTHPASFRKYLKERFADKVNLKEFNYINGEIDSVKECKRLDDKISNVQIDVAFIGIGENAHIAFNDPPADFETDKPYLVVNLDEACRKQQLGEGWFKTLEEVPAKAISMSINQILKSKSIICTVPDFRKAEAVKNSVEGEISPNVPASILKKHNSVNLYLDRFAASLLSKK